ncbi:GntR family transcriptional regulator [Lacrimispora sp.]|uniref:GntR family transcriptional regulator n=1 Tax=Lacrimispora sp. TaxID=2719234 RepID=UPI003460B799
MAKINLKTLAYNTIKQKIVQCEYAPGTDLNEEMLTVELKTSRTPIRDALSRLEQEGLIEIRPKKGITVTPLSAREINMIFELRNMYEPHILMNYGENIDQKQLKYFYDIFSKENRDSKCFKDNDFYYELDTSLHQLIVSACPNTYIQNDYNLIRTQSERFRYLTGNKSNNRLEDTFKEHLDIIVPCLNKEWAAATEKLIYHLEESKKATFQLVFETLEDSIITF